MPPIGFPKLQRFCANPYTSQIELKFRIQCYGTIRELLRHDHFALSKQSVFSLHPNVQPLDHRVLYWPLIVLLTALRSRVE